MGRGERRREQGAGTNSAEDKADFPAFLPTFESIRPQAQTCLEMEAVQLVLALQRFHA